MPKNTKRAKAPRGYNSSDYPPFAVTVDLAVFTIRQGLLCVLLIERAEEPYQQHWALPGGFVGVDETVEAAALRELCEETGLTMFPGHMEQLRTYGDPDRDPRMRVVSVAHVAFAPSLPPVTGGSDAAQARWWPVIDVSELPLAFDHHLILSDALERVRSKLEYTTLATQFLDDVFTLSDLQRVYETVWGVSLDAGNFRRKVQSSEGFVTPQRQRTQAQLDGKPRRGRPAELFRAGTATQLHPPLTRPPESSTANKRG